MVANESGTFKIFLNNDGGMQDFFNSGNLNPGTGQETQCLDQSVINETDDAASPATLSKQGRSDGMTTRTPNHIHTQNNKSDLSHNILSKSYLDAHGIDASRHEEISIFDNKKATPDNIVD
jgi:hypothetical protein